MIRCPWCGAKNYAIDMWCKKCTRHLDWAPPRRRRSRIVGILAPVAAAVGVAIALALPAASWFNGQREAPLPSLPKTALAPSPTSPEAQTTLSAEPSPSAESTPAAGSSPPAEMATPLPTPPPALPPVLAVPNQALAPADGDPAAAVSQFYDALSGHQFGEAASLWTARMQAQYPPAVYIDQRFSSTERIDVASERVIANAAGIAVVSVDVIEVIGGETRRWVGTWQLVHTDSGWLLNQPNLRAG